MPFHLLRNIQQYPMRQSINYAAKIAFLFYDASPSIKKDGNEEVDIPMGYFDIRMLILEGVYMLNLLGKYVDIDSIGLYRDDELEYWKAYQGPQFERVIKNSSKSVEIVDLKSPTLLTISLWTSFMLYLH